MATECCDALSELKLQYDSKVAAIVDKIMAIREADRCAIATNKQQLSVLNSQLSAARKMRLSNEQIVTNYIASTHHFDSVQTTPYVPASEIAFKIQCVTNTIAKYENRLRACYSGNPDGYTGKYPEYSYNENMNDLDPKKWYRIGEYGAHDFDYKLVVESALSFEDQIHRFIKNRYALRLLRRWWMNTHNDMKLNSTRRASTPFSYREDVIVLDDDYHSCFSKYYDEYCAYVRDHDRIVKKDGGMPIDTMEGKILREIIEKSGVMPKKFGGFSANSWVDMFATCAMFIIMIVFAMMVLFTMLITMLG